MPSNQRQASFLLPRLQNGSDSSSCREVVSCSEIRSRICLSSVEDVYSNVKYYCSVKIADGRVCPGLGISLDWWFKRNKDSKLSSQGWAKSAASDAGFGVRPPIAISCWIGIENSVDLRSQLRRKPLAPPIHLLHWNAPVNSVVSANAQAIVKAA